MLDIKLIKENPEQVKAGLRAKEIPCDAEVDRVLVLDEQRRDLIHETEQQKADESACYTWAVQQSGFDPAKPPPTQAATKPPTTATGTTPGAGVRGAARGAVIGEVVGGDAGAGAAAGAVAARGQSRRQNAAAAQQGQQQANAQQQQQQAAFGKARAACLEGRGYSVK